MARNPDGSELSLAADIARLAQSNVDLTAAMAVKLRLLGAEDDALIAQTASGFYRIVTKNAQIRATALLDEGMAHGL